VAASRKFDGSFHGLGSTAMPFDANAFPVARSRSRDNGSIGKPPAGMITSAPTSARRCAFRAKANFISS
jgi:hypothetical protein